MKLRSRVTFLKKIQYKISAHADMGPRSCVAQTLFRPIYNTYECNACIKKTMKIKPMNLREENVPIFNMK